MTAIVIVTNTVDEYLPQSIIHTPIPSLISDTLLSRFRYLVSVAPPPPLYVEMIDATLECVQQM